MKKKGNEHLFLAIVITAYTILFISRADQRDYILIVMQSLMALTLWFEYYMNNHYNGTNTKKALYQVYGFSFISIALFGLLVYILQFVLNNGMTEYKELYIFELIGGCLILVTYIAQTMLHHKIYKRELLAEFLEECKAKIEQEK